MKKIADLIQNIVSGASAAHAYLIEDERAYARDEFIKTLAQGLECTSPKASERPCGRCDACRQARAGTSLDIVHMTKSGKTSYTVRYDVEPFIQRLEMGAYGNFLIGIIDEAEIMSEGIQNKLLKTLEEPREFVILLLGAANSEQLLETVRSRVGVIRPAQFEGFEYKGDDKASEELQKLASLLLDKDKAFYEVRAAIDKNAKTKSDAILLIDAVEDIVERRMKNEGRLKESAAVFEMCERARMDMERDMRADRALKKLRLEITGAQ